MANRNDEANKSLNFYLKIIDENLEIFIRHIPDSLTLSNLIFGLFSLILSMNGFYRLSSLCILLAALCNYFDRRLSRIVLLEKKLNYLVDIISFGVAPIILAHSIKHWSFLMIIAFIAFPLSCVWRTARLDKDSTHDYFVGLPIPIAGILVALLALFSSVSPLIMIGLSILIISPLQIPKL